jgi:NADH dehydrogenase
MSAPRAPVVGGGFAGLHALRRLERLLPPEAADLVLVNPTDHLVYSPLLPDVTASTLEPRHVAVSLRQALRRTRVVLGHARSADREGRPVQVAVQEGGAPDGTDWIQHAVLSPQSASLSLVRPEDALIAAAQGTDGYAEALAPEPARSTP